MLAEDNKNRAKAEMRRDVDFAMMRRDQSWIEWLLGVIGFTSVISQIKIAFFGGQNRIEDK